MQIIYLDNVFTFEINTITTNFRTEPIHTLSNYTLLQNMLDLIFFISSKNKWACPA